MEPVDTPRECRVLLPAFALQDGRAIVRVMRDAGIATHLCTVRDLAQEIRVGVGAIVLSEEAMTETVLLQLAKLIEEQPIWSDIPLVILTTQKRDSSANWRLIRNAPSIRNATFLERPMRIATLLQAVRVALRGRKKQYRLRDQMLEREQLLALSERSEQRLSAVLNNTRMAVFFADDRQHCTFMNAAAENLSGYSLAEMQGRTLHDTLHHTYPDGRPYPQLDCPIDHAFPEHNQTEGEEVFIHKDGHFFPVAFTASPIRQKNAAVGTVIEVRDITQQKADLERLHMLMNELNHRVKNTLATVQSIFLQTMEGEGISDCAKDRVMSRVMALSRSQDLLTEKSWVSAPLRDVAYRALAPFGASDDGPGKLSISGAEFELQPKTALAIAMGLHELATNAVKYGALSVEGGSVDLSWKLIPGDILQLKWVERGGPPVKEPRRSGFGRRLIERGLAHELGGEARIGFHHDGVVCEIDVPTATALVATRKRISDDQSDFAERPKHPAGGRRDDGGHAA
jgi:PAS domain S-box-containing protein